jgi:predicted restriction endonuclease
MGENKIFEMSDVMPIYWTDGISTIPLVMTQVGDIHQVSSISENPLPPKRERIEIIRIIRDTAKSKELKQRYNYLCQVCSKPLPTRDGFYSEVHHLQPLGADHKGVDDEENMIVVCPNHHALFDSGAIAIIPETLHVISFDGTEIGSLFVETTHQIDSQYLRYHFEKRFKRQVA